MKAIVRPSGDHAGSSSIPAPVVKGLSVCPDVVTIHNFVYPVTLDEKTTSAPLGDIDGLDEIIPASSDALRGVITNRNTRLMAEANKLGLVIDALGREVGKLSRLSAWVAASHDCNRAGR